jgi:DNA-binding GntR family transcriptional regulator
VRLRARRLAQVLRNLVRICIRNKEIQEYKKMTTRSAARPAEKAELAYAAIRRAIIEQALVPGTKLPEDQLGLQFGVSRTLVRTVLGRLASEALIEVGNKRSATVAQPSLEEARAVFQVRRCLEAQALRLVIERWQPAMGAALEGHVREEEQAARAHRVPVSIRLAGEFHIALARMTGNPLLERYLSEVVTRCSLILAVYDRAHSSDCACSEHRRLIEVLRRRDVDAAERLMAEHLSGIESRALIPELPREGHDLSAVLSRYANDLREPQARPLKAAARAAPKRSGAAR